MFRAGDQPITFSHCHTRTIAPRTLSLWEGADEWPRPAFRSWDTVIVGVWWIAHDPAKVGDQVRLLTRILATLEPDGQATGCNPVEVGSIPTGVSNDRSDATMSASISALRVHRPLCELRVSLLRARLLAAALL